jgi:predicted lactoylglutathione lyase
MANEVWINIPTRDIQKSKEFYLKLGYALREPVTDAPGIVQLIVDETHSILNLLEEPDFRKLSRSSSSDTTEVRVEMVITIDSESKAEVDDFYVRACRAGAKIFNSPHQIESGYEFTFADPDDHHWKILYRKVKRPLIKSFFDGQDVQNQG